MNITVHMFTGDTKEKAEEISKELNIEDVNYSMLPNDKYNYLEKIITNKKGRNHRSLCWRWYQ